jgi:hypothetical protein
MPSAMMKKSLPRSKSEKRWEFTEHQARQRLVKLNKFKMILERIGMLNSQINKNSQVKELKEAKIQLHSLSPRKSSNNRS